ncbi:hypothetical protein [Undibacterium sp. TC9W]|uniref:hypothetical protein n=1 Tax=Undibacterium sp. TC9W TaxID=3413053 RepID=UPI003BF04622
MTPLDELAALIQSNLRLHAILVQADDEQKIVGGLEYECDEKNGIGILQKKFEICVSDSKISILLPLGQTFTSSQCDSVQEALHILKDHFFGKPVDTVCTR